MYYQRAYGLDKTIAQRKRVGMVPERRTIWNKGSEFKLTPLRAAIPAVGKGQCYPTNSF